VACLGFSCQSGYENAPAPTKIFEGEHRNVPSGKPGLDAPAIDVERYDLAGKYDWSNRRLVASVTLTLGGGQAPPSSIVLSSMKKKVQERPRV